MSTSVYHSNMLYLQHGGGEAELRRELIVDHDETKLLRPFRILASLLQEVKKMFQEHRSSEIENLYQLFAAYGGPVIIVLDLTLQDSGRCSKVYQSMRNIANQKIRLLRSQMTRHAHKGAPPDVMRDIDNSELNHWDNLCDSTDVVTARTLHDRFDDLIHGLMCPSASLSDLELAIRRLRIFLTFEIDSLGLESSTAVLTRELSHCSLGHSSFSNDSTDVRVSVGSVGGMPQIRACANTSFEDSFNADDGSINRNGRGAVNCMPLVMSHEDLTHTTRSSLSSTYTSSHSSGNGLEYFGSSNTSASGNTPVLQSHSSYVGEAGKGAYRTQQMHQSQNQRLMMQQNWGTNDEFDDLCDADSFSQHADGNWLSKTELPRRPFKSRECDFFKQGKCSKEVCNFAHGNKEKDWWTALYQGMIPCKTPGCLGRANGCLSAHSPDEQLASKFRYEDTVNTVTVQPGRGDRVGSEWSNGGVGMSPQNAGGAISQYGTHRNVYITQSNEASATALLGDNPGVSNMQDGLSSHGGKLNTPACASHGLYSWDDPQASSPHDSHNWLGKNDLPRPFRSKKCDFFASSGLCIKPVCNYAHDKTEMLFWSDLFQTMFRCNNKGCTGKGLTTDRVKFVCTYSHSPEEQLSNMQAYETAVANAKVYSRQPPGTSGGNGTSANGSADTTNSTPNQNDSCVQPQQQQFRTQRLGGREDSEAMQPGSKNTAMIGRAMWTGASATVHPQQMQHYTHQQTPFNLAGTSVNLSERLGSSGGEPTYSMNGLGTATNKGAGSHRGDAMVNGNSAPCRPEYTLSSDHIGVKDVYKSDGSGYGMRW
ncbi:hypothetical protein SARC_04048 [Sphaeroforma arctica JP610]|uniref:C3H1-type domain-containing protein n=1 Tax=Sphaeroforma arctica JP610 TaxID=667725 RepID=A0A0L0G680_9EUKA|nr:hypothetical protein SARC_04048 [Sphaeroforma arctica JP610]KNC83718.1 hypothetical protein SARC_04048 [Sphaeroforma arctica JP610]|eukprot:XP_014157620.1 hypothetical protein SARC_04048 [Sphaeroforma arctica JP610]